MSSRPPSVADLRRSLIPSGDVLSERYSAPTVLEDELRHGNGNLIEILSIVGMGGPFTVLSPWELRDPAGHRTLNGSGYSALPFGDSYPPLVEFVKAYLDQSRQINLPQQGASPWRAALETNLIRLLSSFAPSHADSRVFFSNSGTEAVEGAVKFAQAARPRAKHLIHFSRAYHGKTLLSLSLTPNPSIRRTFEKWLVPTTLLEYGNVEQFRSTVKKLGADSIVCVILEPIQGEAGVIVPPEGFLRAVGELCREQGILVVADEIQTGLGRTGHWFESLAQGLEPDILCLAKPLGGGLTAVGATLVRDWIFRKMLGRTNDLKRHSNTFGGNSLAMAIGLRSLEVLLEEDLPGRSKRLGLRGLEVLRAMQARHPELIAEVRGAGMLMVMGFQPILGSRLLHFQRQLIAEATGLLALRAFYRGGVQLNFTLNAARAVRLTPALTVPDALFEEMLLKLEHTADRMESSFGLLRDLSGPEFQRMTAFVLKNG